MLLQLSIEVDEHRSTALDRDTAMAVASEAALRAVLGLPGAYNARMLDGSSDADAQDVAADSPDAD
jgi:hypothetical protein